LDRGRKLERSSKRLKGKLKVGRGKMVRGLDKTCSGRGRARLKKAGTTRKLRKWARPVARLGERQVGTLEQHVSGGGGRVSRKRAQWQKKENSADDNYFEPYGHLGHVKRKGVQEGGMGYVQGGKKTPYEAY